MFGIDLLEVGNEEKIVIVMISPNVEEVLSNLKKTPEGKNTAIIGETTDFLMEVVLETEVGGKSILAPPIGDPVLRIC